MLHEVFYWLFNMSIAAVICGVPVLLIRFIKKIPRRVFAWLWWIPFIRMCIPVGISGKYSLMWLIAKFTTKTVTVYELGEACAVTAMNCVMGANSYSPVIYKFYLLEKLFSLASIIWLIGVLSCVLILFVTYWATMREMRGALLLKDNIFVSDKIRTPSVYGIIRPKIVLPQGYKESDFAYIIMHENAHIKRGDNLLRIAALILVCVHWWNPFAWVFLKLLYSDIEMACDETVLAKCSKKQGKEYAHALLSTAEKTNVFAAPFGGMKIRTRIENILSYQKISVLSSIAFAALILCIAYILLTNAL